MTDWKSVEETGDIDRNTINKIILNYLIFEGYESTSYKFAKELGIDLTNNDNDNDDNVDLIGINSISFRKEIKSNILRGEIQIAIDKLNLKIPNFLETNQFLYFKLLLLNLIEMIKLNKDNKKMDSKLSRIEQQSFVLKIIKFAQEKLTNRAIKNPKFMEELELTMTLLLYSNHSNHTGDNHDEKTELPTKLNELFEFKLRRDISDLINKSILLNDLETIVDVDYKNDEKDKNDNDADDDDFVSNDSNIHLIDSSLKKLIKFWIWGENTIQNKYNDDEFKPFTI